MLVLSDDIIYIAECNLYDLKVIIGDYFYANMFCTLAKLLILILRMTSGLGVEKTDKGVEIRLLWYFRKVYR